MNISHRSLCLVHLFTLFAFYFLLYTQIITIHLIFIQPQLSTRKKCFNFQLTNIAVYIISNHISNYNYWTLMDGIARFYVDLSYFFFTVESYNPDTANHGKKQHCQHVQFISYVNNNRQCLFLQQFLTNCCKNSRESYSYNK